MGRPGISVIIPCLNEARRLPAAIDSCRSTPPVEIVVVDGGSQDGSPAVARDAGAQVLSAPRGRAVQMNRGAEAAQGEILLFLHADTRLPDGFAREVTETLAPPGRVAGAFRLRIDGPGALLRLIERAANLRSRLLQAPYGDQGLFLPRSLFFDLGRFPPLPILEDLELVRRLRRRGRIGQCRSAVVTSARRWETVGPLRNTALNQCLLLAHGLRVPPQWLARIYDRGSAR